jgi:hypothetical protein
MRQCNTCDRRSNLTKKTWASADMYLSRNISANLTAPTMLVNPNTVEARDSIEMRNGGKCKRCLAPFPTSCLNHDPKQIKLETW